MEQELSDNGTEETEERYMWMPIITNMKTRSTQASIYGPYLMATKIVNLHAA